MPFENNGTLRKWHKTNATHEIDKYDTHKKWCLTKMAHLAKKCPEVIYQKGLSLSLSWNAWISTANQENWLIISDLGYLILFCVTSQNTNLQFLPTKAHKKKKEKNILITFLQAFTRNICWIFLKCIVYMVSTDRTQINYVLPEVWKWLSRKIVKRHTLLLFSVPTDVINLCGKIPIRKLRHHGREAM